MADLRMPEGLSECERQQWLEELRRQIVEETGQSEGVIEQQVPDGQPVWAMWGTTEAGPEPAPTSQDEAAAR
jgi:hypothetical protein